MAFQLNMSAIEDCLCLYKNLGCVSGRRR